MNQFVFRGAKASPDGAAPHMLAYGDFGGVVPGSSASSSGTGAKRNSPMAPVRPSVPPAPPDEDDDDVPPGGDKLTDGTNARKNSSNSTFAMAGAAALSLRKSWQNRTGSSTTIGSGGETFTCTPQVQVETKDPGSRSALALSGSSGLAKPIKKLLFQEECTSASSSSSASASVTPRHSQRKPFGSSFAEESTSASSSSSASASASASVTPRLSQRKPFVASLVEALGQRHGDSERQSRSKGPLKMNPLVQSSFSWLSGPASQPKAPEDSAPQAPRPDEEDGTRSTLLAYGRLISARSRTTPGGTQNRAAEAAAAEHEHRQDGVTQKRLRPTRAIEGTVMPGRHSRGHTLTVRSSGSDERQTWHSTSTLGDETRLSYESRATFNFGDDHDRDHLTDDELAWLSGPTSQPKAPEDTATQALRPDEEDDVELSFVSVKSALNAYSRHSFARSKSTPGRTEKNAAEAAAAEHEHGQAGVIQKRLRPTRAIEGTVMPGRHTRSHTLTVRSAGSDERSQQGDETRQSYESRGTFNFGDDNDRDHLTDDGGEATVIDQLLGFRLGDEW
eukprot:CAMPEP_0203853348 /NCGR_PEP_ID=MMETSP0359-20131031/8484_1 /ASSEMBLY_ACC=CAM_ASM_000338 /TAXON_ID=268821 /ORGANISM="Scrippsiella Hangoei, Strain SHTV-5" /LENGTH=561 /DNA_ID=CAMNT_0050769695 /DNA_START=162 /DNA_END=1847 /DNA_ORIENTATION=-